MVRWVSVVVNMESVMRDDDDEREVEEMNTYLSGCEDEDDEEEC